VPRATAMRAALVLLTAMRRAMHGRAGTSGRAYLKEVRSVGGPCECRRPQSNA
jgi:hypothetical protein